MMASGEAVPITSLEGVTTSQAEVLEQKGITDVEKLAATSVDDLVDALDVSLDEAEAIIAAASAIVAAKEEEAGEKQTDSESVEGEDISTTLVENPVDEQKEELTAEEGNAVIALDSEADSIESAESTIADVSDAEIRNDEISEAGDEAASQEPETPAEEER
jgi:nucleotidyltransferase/DNA polymerase involved in DNA repair